MWRHKCNNNGIWESYLSYILAINDKVVLIDYLFFIRICYVKKYQYERKTTLLPVYGYFSNYANSRSEVATKTEGFLKDLLKGRISVYQFLRSPTEDNKQKTIAIFESLNKKVTDIKSTLSVQKNIDLCDAIINSTKNYIRDFEAVSAIAMANHKNGIEKETQELRDTVSKMAQTGTVVENEITKITESALQLKEYAYEALNTILISQPWKSQY